MKSNVVQIRVTEPPKSEKQAFALLAGKTNAMFLHGMKGDRALIEHFEKFLQNHSGVTQAKYVRYVLAKAYMIRVDERPKDLKEGIRILKDLIQDYPTFSWSDDATLEIGKCYAEMGETNNAVIWFRKVLDDFPGSSSEWTATFALEILKGR